MTLDEAITVLGVASGDDQSTVRARYRELMRRHHPDVAHRADSGTATEVNASLITEAYSVIAAALTAADDGCVPFTAPTSVTAGESAPRDLHPTIHSEHDGEILCIEAPPDEAYQRLLDAAAQLGGIGHVDRTLGLLEVTIRFEGGPSCSVLMTLHGRVHGTDVVVEMESIEAAPTPPIAPVLEALVELLRSGS